MTIPKAMSQLRRSSPNKRIKTAVLIHQSFVIIIKYLQNNSSTEFNYYTSSIKSYLEVKPSMTNCYFSTKLNKIQILKQT